MTFSFLDDEQDEQEIWRCKDCGWTSTERHFRDGPCCTLCDGDAEHVDTQTQSSEMSAFQYQQILSYLSDEVDGVGETTTESIKSSFENGDNFIDACRDAYDDQAYDELTHVSGVGEATARAVALGMADRKGWEDGLAESKFSVTVK